MTVVPNNFTKADTLFITFIISINKKVGQLPLKNVIAPEKSGTIKLSRGNCFTFTGLMQPPTVESRGVCVETGPPV